MSQTVEVDFEQIGFECFEVIERATQRVEGVKKMLDIFNQYPSQELARATADYLSQVNQIVDQWEDELNTLQVDADKLRRLGVGYVDTDSYHFRNRYRVKDDCYDCLRQINGQCFDIKANLYAMNKELKALRRQNSVRRQDNSERETSTEREISSEKKTSSEKPVSVSSLQPTRSLSVVETIDSIKDPLLCQATYLAYLSNPEAPLEEILKKGETQRDETMRAAKEKTLQEEKERYTEELKKANVDSDEIRKMMEKVNASNHPGETLSQEAERLIIDESLRKNSLKCILKAIKEQGFIVNPKNIRKNGDEVTLLAQKVGGETAKFTVYLDGKFVYDFKGYEGQACQKDIEPFMNDLKNIYGFDVKEMKEIWRNPDKIDNRKIQSQQKGHING